MGNNCMVVNSDGTVEQVTHYYPYGGVIGDISTNENLQKYKFEGKELDRTFGLDNYDIHARQYFAMAPMWDKIDPLTEENPQFSPYSYCMGDPVNLGDYNGMIPTFEEGAALANHVYEGDKNEQVGDWTCISITVNKSNGLRYGIYSHKKDTGDIEYALVFAGTSDSKDWDTDKKQALGKLNEWQLSESGLMEKSQYGEAVDASISFLKDHNNQETTIVGHSLGGGLAAVGSMKTGIQCMTYNPAGLHENTIKNLGINQAPTEQIHNYVLFGEGVSILNKVMPNISVPGKTSYCFNTFSFSFSILTLYINHKIGSF